MFRSSAVRAAVVATALAALGVSCGTSAGTDEPGGSTVAAAGRTGPASSPLASPDAGGSPDASSASNSSSASTPPSPPAEKVRDAFAGLQATLDDSCTPGNCAYFLGRVYDELHRLERAMRADPKGPGHFPEPLARIEKLDTELGGDRTFENLKKHQESLIGTRDQINTWMQGHPDDYR
ncbi:hypothetical protein [Streptomyces sp. NPDC058335]|uniref:hypothetical protein n=1 Tax=Streptomyces sp. NPDC058335 TaxID=3346451 RepID=UPI00364FA2A4